MSVDDGLILAIMCGLLVAFAARRHYLAQRRETLIRDFLADPARRDRQGY